MTSTVKHIDRLKGWFQNHKGTVTAFSGGVDSSLVLFVSKLVLDNKGVGLISNSESLKSRDFIEAIEFCDEHDVLLEVIKTNEINDSNYTSNPANRCFFCKNHLYESMIDLIQVKYPGYTILNGTNLDDLGDYRPGLQAAKNHQIRSPLVELKIDKKMVIEMADYLGLKSVYKPPSPCLSSRIPYGTPVNANRLKQIEKAEYILNEYGFMQVRVRHYGSTASIEVPIQQMDSLQLVFGNVSEEIKKLGFTQVLVDKEGLVSGKLNKAIL